MTNPKVPPQTNLRVYNTLTRQKEPFVPLVPGEVRMYTCGPTVYHYIHIGNARAAVVFDVVRRYLAYRGFRVTYVQNFTDVDDKLINAAREMGLTVPEVAERFIAAYREDVRALGVREPDVAPRVTEHIPEIIAFIQGLIDKGLAYEADGDVYFRTARFPAYGKLSHQPLDELMAGARVEVSEKKENPLDFALWKKAKAPDEIAWDSPWGRGRPGWHIECSAMSRRYLGDSFDIHAGGQDLIFPHHENEIAQSEGLTGKPMARYWLHNGFVNIKGEKMSKSLGNVLLVRELRRQHDPMALRFFLLSVHYRNPINFSEELLAQAEVGLARLRTAVENLRFALGGAREGAVEPEVAEAVSTLRARFVAEMDDDFNTANAITVLFDAAREANQYVRRDAMVRGSVQAFLDLFAELAEEVLGLTLAPQAEASGEDDSFVAEVERLIAERQEARKRKDWATADAIRDRLNQMGVIVEDTPHGVRWRRK